MSGSLILVRHGESVANAEGTFAGWLDSPLTDKGRWEAKAVAQILRRNLVPVSLGYSSALSRAKETLDVVLDELRYSEIPRTYAEELNERHYGVLQGMHKTEVLEKYGEIEFRKWRRGYMTGPVGGESLRDCKRRVVSYFKEHIQSELKRGASALLVGHNNSLRGLVMYLERLSIREVEALDIPNAEIRLYFFDSYYGLPRCKKILS